MIQVNPKFTAVQAEETRRDRPRQSMRLRQVMFLVIMRAQL